MRREDVDVVLRRAHVGILRRHRRETLVPERHAVNDAVGLGRGRDVALRARHGKFERVADHPVAATSREHRALDGQLFSRTSVKPAADLGVLAFVVLTHDHHVDIVWAAPGQRRPYACEQPYRSAGDVLSKPSANRNQEPPQRHVIRYARKAYGAQIDRVELAKLVASVLPGSMRPVLV